MEVLIPRADYLNEGKVPPHHPLTSAGILYENIYCDGHVVFDGGRNLTISPEQFVAGSVYFYCTRCNTKFQLEPKTNQ